jgi:putative Mg2+ transporter-C (MgtC) family protein
LELPTVHLEIIGDVTVYFGMGVQIVAAVILGGAVGWDRESKMKAAGIKTNIMICLGATLYTAISIIIQKGSGQMADPNRVAAQIVSGIGFLGAGAIIQGRRNVIGLTTAATIWVVAAIGYTIGAGYPVIAALFTLTTLLVLKFLDPFYLLFELRKDHRHFHIEILSHGGVKHSVKEIILSEIDTINQIHEKTINEARDERMLNVYVTMHPRRIPELVSDLKKIIRVEKVNYHVADHSGQIVPEGE